MPTFARAQFVPSTNGADPATVSFTPTAATSLLLCVFDERSGDGTSGAVCSDDGATGDDWAKFIGHDQEISDPNARQSFSGFWKVAGSTATITISADDGTSNGKLSTIHEYTTDEAGTWSVATASVSNDTGTGASSPLDLGTTASVSAGNILAVALASWRNGNSFPNDVAFDGSFSGTTGVYGDSNQRSLATAWQQSAGGTTFNSNVSWTGADHECAGGISVFGLDTGGGGASQSIAFTLEGVAVAVDQTASHPQELAATLAGVSVAIEQTLQHEQALASTLDGVAVSVDQTAQHPQALAATLDGISVEINQSVTSGESQSIAFTLDGVSVAIEQTATHGQALAATLDGIAVSIEQGSQHAQTLDATLDGVSVEINQSVAQPEKDQALSIVLDGVGVSINQVGPDNIPMGGGFFSYAWRRRLMEEELREQLKELPEPVAEVIERQVIESVDRPKLPSPKELRARLERENIPYRQAYQKAMVSLVNEMRQREDDEEEEEAIAMAMASLV